MRQPRTTLRETGSPKSDARRRRLRRRPVAERHGGNPRQIRNPKDPNDRNAPNEPNPTRFSWLGRSKWANLKQPRLCEAKLVPAEAGKTRNPTQMPSTEWMMTETLPPGGSGVWNFGFGSFGLVSSFDIRISCFARFRQPSGVSSFVPNEANFPRLWLENAGWVEKQSQFMERRTGGLSPLCVRPLPHRTGRLSPLTRGASGFIMAGSERNLEPGFPPDRPLAWPAPCDEPLGIRDLRSQIPVGQEFD